MIVPRVDSSSFLAIAACIIAAWILRVNAKRRSFHEILRHGLLLVHTLYVLYTILVAPPRNVFTETKSQIKTPVAYLRSLYTARSSSRELDLEFDRLFQKLNSFDMRLMYFQLGHDAIAGCDFCSTYEEYLSFCFARPLFAYILGIALIGALTLPGSSQAHLRALGMGLLLSALIAEFVATLTAPQVLASGALVDWMAPHWHDSISFLRSLLFLLVPLMIHAPRIPIIHNVPILNRLLPVPDRNGGAPRTAQSLQQLQETLDTLVPRLHLISYTRAAIMRKEDTRKRASKWWSVEGKEGHSVLEDEVFQKTAKGVGMGYGEEDDAPLRGRARKGLDAMFQTVPPSLHWVK